ncbi:MAG TPA: hypothetical protein VGK67_40830 [Myxococcales bacterium]|jgi:hypothetical protein
MNACLLSLLGVLALAAGDDAVTARARADVESALRKVQAGIPPPRLILSVKPSAGRGFALEQASFALDNQALPAPAKLIGSQGVERIFAGEIAPGPHELIVKMQYAGDFGLLSYMTGYKFKLQQKVEFDATRGLEIALVVSPAIDENKEWQQRLGLKVERTQEMLAEVDATEPEPLARPKLAVAAPDSGVLPPPPVLEVAGELPSTPDAGKATRAKDQRRTRVATAKSPSADPASAEPDLETAADEPEEPEAAPPPAPDAAVPEQAPIPEMIVTNTAALMPAPEPAPEPEDKRAFLFGAVGFLVLGAIAFALYRRQG